MAQWGVLEAAGVWIASWGYGYDPAAVALFLDTEVDEEWDQDVEPPWAPRDASRYRTTAGIIRSRLQLLGVDAVSADNVVSSTWAQMCSIDDSIAPDLERLVLEFMKERERNELFELDSASTTLQEKLSTLDCEWQQVLRYFVDRLRPDEEVVLDLSAVWHHLADVGIRRSPTFCADTRQEVRNMAFGAMPTIVLTEGSSDAEVLTAALEVVRPQYEGFLTFMDYSTKPAGGVDAVIKGVRAFAAAGVGNQIVGLLDNDTAGAVGRRALASSRLPSRIRILQLPLLPRAQNYPTLGTEGLVLKDVNGIAVSIEHFLGVDVLTNSEGAFHPVQLTGWVAAESAYQGEILGKSEIKSRFWDKLGRARRGDVDFEMWDDLGYLLDYIVAQMEVM